MASVQITQLKCPYCRKWAELVNVYGADEGAFIDCPKCGKQCELVARRQWVWQTIYNLAKVEDVTCKP